MAEVIALKCLKFAITPIMKLLFGIVVGKLRTYGAEKLQDGGLADQKFRDWIVREGDDINFKLDANARKDLLVSISCLGKGYDRLQLQDTTNAGASSTETTTAQKSVTLDDALALANAVEKLNIESNELFESAKESFKEAGMKASEAFHNASLSTEDRVLASKVRIASAILEQLDDPDVAASDCLRYLRELHAMPAIQQIFLVHLQGGMKSFFKKETRANIVETITMINLILADFISKFTQRRMAVFDWPMIECGTRVVHPIHYDQEIASKMKNIEITPPWDIVQHHPLNTTESADFAVNSKGDIIGTFRSKNPGKLEKATGTWQRFSRSPLALGAHVVDVAIDDTDTVYILSFSSIPMLSGYSSDGRITKHYSSEVFGNIRIPYTREVLRRFTVTKDKRIVFYSEGRGNNVTVYLCDSNCKLMKSFPVRLQSGYKSIVAEFVSSDESANNEIILATEDTLREADGNLLHPRMLHVYTQDGMLQRTVTLQQRSHWQIISRTFNHITKNYIVCSEDYGSNIVCMECFSETGELRNLLFLDMEYAT
ncbi:Hypothetical predicted protein, partial [Paramuricea clavata]